MDIQKEIENLIEENKKLKRKLEVAQIWMEREVKNQIHNVAKKKLKKLDEKDKIEFDIAKTEEKISNQIMWYFGEIMLLNAPKWVVESIMASEIHFHNMEFNKNLDGLSVVSWYHKAFDALIETMITKAFRKFAKKQKNLVLRVNDPLEKTLNMVVNKSYILGTGRLYALLYNIRNWKDLYDFGRCFEAFLDKNEDIKEILLDDSYYLNFTKLNKIEVLGKKRHKWIIRLDETKIARELLVWNFMDENSIIFMMMKKVTWI